MQLRNKPFQCNRDITKPCHVTLSAGCITTWRQEWYHWTKSKL